MDIHGIDNRNGLLIERFTQETARILGDNLVGVYLHGSAVMGCFHPAKSDLDLLVVVEHAMTDEAKREFMDMVIQLNDEAPAKGIEMSIVRREVCKPFAYPTPFELHFSAMHLGWYRDDPEDYIRKMNGTDKDLAAHCTVIRARGRCLFGAPIPEIFGEVSKQDYMDSLWYDIAEAAEEIAEDTMYLTLNLARVLAFQQEGRVLSKQEGGEWALARLPEINHAHLRNALAEYRGEKPEYDIDAAKDYAAEMLRLIRDNMRPQIELESMTPACYERAMRIPRDDEAETFVGSVDELINNAEYGRVHNLIGNIFLIKADGKDVGYLMIGEAFPWPTDPPEMKGRDYYRLMYFMIESQSRGRGIGGEAMERAIDITYRQFGARPLALGCHRDNAAGRRFYVKHGFRETPYKEGDDCYMLRDL